METIFFFVTLILALLISTLSAALMSKENKEKNLALAVFFMSVPSWMIVIFLAYYLSLIEKLLINAG